MRKTILAMALCGLIPVVSIAVAQAEDYDEEEFEFDEDFFEDDFEEEVEDVVEDVVAEEKPVQERKVVDNRNVAQRMTCADVKKEMNRLNAMDVLDENAAARLAELKKYNWSYCTKKVASDRLAGRIKSKTVVSKPVPDSDVECDNPDNNGCCPGESYVKVDGKDFYCCNDSSKKCYPPMQVQKDYSLCDDGGKPDKNGCCKGETYTDLGELGFNCCLSDKVTCFPPLK